MESSEITKKKSSKAVSKQNVSATKSGTTDTTEPIVKVMDKKSEQSLKSEPIFNSIPEINLKFDGNNFIVTPGVIKAKPSKVIPCVAKKLSLTFYADDENAEDWEFSSSYLAHVRECPTATNLPMNPLLCPDVRCERLIFLSDLVEHLMSEHNNVLRIVESGVRSAIAIHPEMIHLHKTTVLATFLIQNKVWGIGSSKFNHLLPVVLCGRRIERTDLFATPRDMTNAKHDKSQPSKGPTKIEENEIIIFWVAGIPVPSIEVHANIYLFNIDCPRNMYRRYKSSINRLPNDKDKLIFGDLQEFVPLAHFDINKFINADCDRVGIQIVFH